MLTNYKYQYNVTYQSVNKLQAMYQYNVTCQSAGIFLYEKKTWTNK